MTRQLRDGRWCVFWPPWLRPRNDGKRWGKGKGREGGVDGGAISHLAEVSVVVDVSSRSPHKAQGCRDADLLLGLWVVVQVHAACCCCIPGTWYPVYRKDAGYRTGLRFFSALNFR